MANNKKQINIRISNPRNYELLLEWEARFGNEKQNISKNKALEEMLFSSMRNEKLNNESDHLVKVIKNVFEEMVERILKRVFGRQDIISLNLIKFLKIEEIKTNFLINQLYEAEIINEASFTDPHKQQLADSPWIKMEKNNIDSTFAYLQKDSIITDFSLLADNENIPVETMKLVNRAVGKINLNEKRSKKDLKQTFKKIFQKNENKQFSELELINEDTFVNDNINMNEELTNSEKSTLESTDVSETESVSNKKTTSSKKDEEK